MKRLIQSALCLFALGMLWRTTVTAAPVAPLSNLRTTEEGAQPSSSGPVTVLTNDDVIKMTGAKLDDSIIITTIRSSQCKFDASPDALIHLKRAGVSGMVLRAMTESAAGARTRGGPEAAPSRPRLFVAESQSWDMRGGFGGTKEGFGGSFHGGARPQTVEVMKTFEERCPGVVVTLERSNADYVVLLDHEGGKGYARKRNKIAVFTKSGDAVFTGSTRSLGNAVKDACQAILGHK